MSKTYIMKNSTQIILQELSDRFPDQIEFRRKTVEDLSKSMGYTGKDYNPLMTDENRVRIGTYSLEQVTLPLRRSMPASEDTTNIPAQMQSIVNQERTYAKVDPTFVPWGSYTDIVKIIKNDSFFPVYISGLSGNGKTFMVEQACAKLNKEFIRVQINPETDEDDLLGGFRLINGETVFAKGPVLKAMENGAVLLLDEIDRATNKIMCLQQSGQ